MLRIIRILIIGLVYRVPLWAGMEMEVFRVFEEFYLNQKPVPRQEAELRGQAVTKAIARVIPVETEIYGKTLNHFGELLKNLERFEEALPMQRSAYFWAKNHLEPEDYVVMLAQRNYALCLMGTGQHVEALPLLEQAHDQAKSVLPKDDSLLLMIRVDLAQCLANVGQYRVALDLAESAYENAKRVLGEDDPQFVYYLNAYATNLFSLGFADRALPLLETAVVLARNAWGKTHPTYFASLSNLSGCYSHLALYDKEADVLWQMFELVKTHYGRNHALFPEFLTRMGTHHQKIGKFQEARAIFEDCVEATNRIQGMEHPYYFIRLNNLGYCLYEMGEFQEALPIMELALEKIQATGGVDGPNLGIAMTNVALALKALGQFEHARAKARDALDWAKRRINNGVLQWTEIEQLQESARFNLFLDFYITMPGVTPKDAFEQIYHWKGNIVIAQRAVRNASEDPNKLPLLKQLQGVSSALSAHLLNVPSEHEQVLEWKRVTADLTQEQKKLELRLNQTAILSNPLAETIDIENLATKLKENQVFIDYYQYSKEGELFLMAHVLDRRGKVHQIRLGDVGLIQDEVYNWLNKIYNKSAGHLQAAQQVKQRIWEPLAEWISESDALLISPYGITSYVPFSALPGNDPETYVIEDQALSFASVPRLLPTILDNTLPEIEKPSLLVIGDIDYGLPSDEQSSDSKPAAFTPLKETATEVAVVAERFQQNFQGTVEKQLQKDATEAAFKASLVSARYMHIATHGYVDQGTYSKYLGNMPATGFSEEQISSWMAQYAGGYDSSMRYGLAFANVNLLSKEAPEDGLLTAHEISFLPLDSVELAVLSACETAVGDSLKGEGIVGLQRAFQVAGVRSCLASLWKVDDAATRVLMDRFYRFHWEDGLSKIEALRQAQLSFWGEQQVALSDKLRGIQRVDTPRSKSQHPYYWAAFQLFGDWN